MLGGAAVTEEIISGTRGSLEGRETTNGVMCGLHRTGYKFSRASYLLSLLRPQIIKDLELKVQFCKYRPTVYDLIYLWGDLFRNTA